MNSAVFTYRHDSKAVLGLFCESFLFSVMPWGVLVTLILL